MEKDKTELCFLALQQGYFHEPIIFDVVTDKPWQRKIDMAAGREATTTDEHMFVNRQGFQKFVIIDSQRLNFDPSSQFFDLVSGNNWDRGTLPEMERWAGESSAAVERRAEKVKRRLSIVTNGGNYPTETGDYQGSQDKRTYDERRELGEAYMIGLL